MTAYIVRYQSDDQGTLGQLLTPSGYQCAVKAQPGECRFEGDFYLQKFSLKLIFSPL
jgi:hypothetical protein